MRGRVWCPGVCDHAGSVVAWPARQTTAARPTRRRRRFRNRGRLPSVAVVQLWPYLGPWLARAGADVDVAAPLPVVEGRTDSTLWPHVGEKLPGVGAVACAVVEGPWRDGHDGGGDEPPRHRRLLEAQQAGPAADDRVIAALTAMASTSAAVPDPAAPAPAFNCRRRAEAGTCCSSVSNEASPVAEARLAEHDLIEGAAEPQRASGREPPRDLADRRRSGDVAGREEIAMR
jgi:hypothetical protein